MRSRPTDPAQAPFGAEAKEFLRKKLIGKRVRVTVDGRRPPQDGFDEREMATIVQNDKNIALLMVENGWVQVVRHRRDDPDRSSIFDELLVAEEEAKKDQRGMWNPEPASAKVYEDISETSTKAKQRFTLLSRQKRIPAVVDFVKSAARLTILIPRENQKLTLVLGGIRAPKTARNPSETSEPFGQEAYDLAVRRLLQRDVEIEVEGTDKVGGFIGTLWITRENFAKILVEEGFASVHAYSAEASSSGSELFAAEKRAQEARRGRWHDWEPEAESANTAPGLQDLKLSTNGTNGSQPRPKDYRDVVVTHVDEAGKLKIQQVGTATSKLEALMSEFRTFHSTPANAKPLSSPPKAGDLVSAKFSIDKTWYRGRVRSNDRDAKASEVLFIDYGNSEKLPWATLRPLTAQFSTTELKPLALDAALAFIQLPSTPQYLAEAIDRIYDLTNDRQLVASIEHEADNTLFVTLFDPRNSEKSEDSFNADLVAEGFATVPKAFKLWEKRLPDLTRRLAELQDEAIKERRGMWEYGDLRED
jgi:staphylococcal nuclease domain-containing protein 1